MWDKKPSDAKELMKESNKRCERLQVLFKELEKCRQILSDDIISELKVIMVEWDLRTHEAEFIQSMRRDQAGAELSMSRKEYEKFLG